MRFLPAMAHPRNAGSDGIITEKEKTEMPHKNQAYTEAFRDGMRAALTLTREHVNAYARKLPVREGDAFLAGYYAELRRLRAA